MKLTHEAAMWMLYYEWRMLTGKEAAATIREDGLLDVTFSIRHGIIYRTYRTTLIPEALTRHAAAWLCRFAYAGMKERLGIHFSSGTAE
ncbi:MAG: hypothetical protein QM757_26540 [Paludibaculum sp.]